MTKRRYSRKRRNTPGSAPGRWLTDPAAAESRLHTLRYGAFSLEETEALPPPPPRAPSG